MSSYMGALRISLAALALLGALTGVARASAQNVASEERSNDAARGRRQRRGPSDCRSRAREVSGVFEVENGLVAAR